MIFSTPKTNHVKTNIDYRTSKHNLEREMIGGVFKLMDGSGVPDVCPWSQCRKVIKRLGYDPNKNYDYTMRRMIERIDRLPSHAILRYVRMLRLWMKPTVIVVKSLTAICLRVAARAGLSIPYVHTPCQNIIIHRVFRRILDTYQEDLIYDMGCYVDFTVYGAEIGEPPLLTWLKRGLFIKAHPCPLHQLSIRFKHDCDPHREIMLTSPTGMSIAYHTYREAGPHMHVHQCGYYRCVHKHHSEIERKTITLELAPIIDPVTINRAAEKRAQKHQRYMNRRR